MSTEPRGEKAAYFDRLAPGWDEMVGNNSSRREKLRGIFDMISLEKGDRVLDVGCGSGVLFPFIEESIGEGGRILAVDPAPAMIARARELHAGHGNIEYMTAFIEDARLADGAFDVILCYAVLPHLDDIPAALRLLRKALSPDGRMYIFHPDDTRTLNEFHGSLKAPVSRDVLPGEEELRRMLEEAGFRVLRYIDRPGLNFVESAP